MRGELNDPVNLAEETPEAYKNVEDVTKVRVRAGISWREDQLRPGAVIKG